MKKLIAISSGDWHLNHWKNHNKDGQRDKMAIRFLYELLDISEESGVPILFTGDLCHTPKSLSNKLVSTLVDLFYNLPKKFPNARILGITGNHDESEGSSYVETFSKISGGIMQCIDDRSIWISDGVKVYGIPYLKHNQGLSEYLDDFRQDEATDKILLIHTNLYGAVDPNGYEVDEVPNIPRDLGSFFKGFDLVLSGHIHKYAEIWEGKVHMVGAPYQQRTSDAGTKMGYVKIYDDLSVEFVEYESPGFVYYYEDEYVPEDGNFNIVIPRPKKIQEEKESEFKVDKDKSKLAKSYCRAKGIKNRRRVRLLINTLSETED